jgi:diadenosine tetraphosphate (Ap4A) HIT family hydrolase
MSSAAGCALCEAAEAGDQRVVFRAAHWLIGPAEHRGVPGWLMIWSRTHTAGFDAVEGDALREFGELLGETTRALKQVLGAERVYVAVFGDNVEHTHALLMARPPGLDAGRTGVSLLKDFDDLRSADRGRHVAAAVGERLASARTSHVNS